MQVYISVCNGIKDMEIKVYLQRQWEDILARDESINDSVLGNANCIKAFDNLTDFMFFVKANDLEIENEWHGVIY